VPGVGPVVASTLIAELPELGRVSREEIAAWRAWRLRPHFGRFRGERTCFGGRADVRKTLYMATITAKRFNPVIRAMSRRLAAAGKAFK
jgi:transposase